MIKPQDIGVTKRQDDVFKHVTYTAGVKCFCSRFAMPDEPSEHVEREARREVWDGIYGDIERSVEPMRRQILMSVGIGGGYVAYQQINAAIDELAKLVRNPFA
jgi:hypothetical protein